MLSIRTSKESSRYCIMPFDVDSSSAMDMAGRRAGGRWVAGGGKPTPFGAKPLDQPPAWEGSAIVASSPNPAAG